MSDLEGFLLAHEWCWNSFDKTWDTPTKAEAQRIADVLQPFLESVWRQAHGWCDDGIDGMCDHQPFSSNPYDHEHDWIEVGEPYDPQACGVCGEVRR